MKRIDPAMKFVALLLVTLILAWKYSLMLNAAVFFACVVGILSCGVSVRRLLALLLPILLAALGMFFTGYRFSAAEGLPVNTEIFHLGSSALVNGLTQASRVLAYAGVGYLFALTTDRVNMVKSFQKRFHLPQIFAYGLLAAWGIFPQMMQEYRRTRAAFRARGLSAFPLSPAVLKPLLVKAVRWSEVLSVAMESKGFSGDAERTEYRRMAVKTVDWLFLLGTVGAAMIAAWLLPV